MKIWYHKNNIGKGFVGDLSNYIDNRENGKEIFLPNLRETDKIYIFSDYGGDLDSKLSCYSILLLDEKSVSYFLASFMKFWRVHFPDFRTIEYKSINTDVYRQKALIPFLELCNNLNGVVFSVIFHKTDKSIFQDEIPDELANKLKTWKDTIAREKFLRLRELILTLLNGLGTNNQKFIWVSDNDNFLSNESRISTVNNIMLDTVKKNLGYNFLGFEIRNLKTDFSGKPFKKLCSIPDIVAGTVVDFIGDHYNSGLINGKVGIYVPIYHEKEKLNLITGWIFKDESMCALKKITLEIKKNDNDVLTIQTYRFPTFYRHVTNFNRMD